MFLLFCWTFCWFYFPKHFQSSPLVFPPASNPHAQKHFWNTFLGNPQKSFPLVSCFCLKQRLFINLQVFFLSLSELHHCYYFDLTLSASRWVDFSTSYTWNVLSPLFQFVSLCIKFSVNRMWKCMLKKISLAVNLVAT